MSLKEENLEIQKKNQNNLRELEKNYVEHKIDTMFENIEQKKQELIADMVKYAKEHEKECKWTKDGEPIDSIDRITPNLIYHFTGLSEAEINKLEK